MNVSFKSWYRQVLAGVLVLLLCSCSNKKADSAIQPPVTSPLMRTVIGYGIINVSYTQLKTEPGVESSSRGYLRRGSVVRILERRMVKNGNQLENWILAEGDYQGWLKEEIVDMYDNELQARTAAESLAQ